MYNNETERLVMRWLPVVDAVGRTRMEATWVALPVATEQVAPVITHAA